MVLILFSTIFYYLNVFKAHMHYRNVAACKRARVPFIKAKRAFTVVKNSLFYWIYKTQAILNHDHQIFGTKCKELL